MKFQNATRWIGLLLMVLIMVSFKDREKVEGIRTGTYGICDCGESNSIREELTLNGDYTFHYFNNDRPGQVIDIHGQWTDEGKTIHLKDFKSAVKVAEKWTVDKTEKCLKSRKGMLWTRLCHVKACD